MRLSLPSLISILALSAATRVTAFDVEMEITPTVLRLGEAAICRIVIRDAQGAPAPQLPALKGFDVVPAGTEQNFSFVNGRQSVSTGYRFQLIPREAGDFQIGPFIYQFNGQQKELPAIRVQVLPAQGGADGQVVRSLDELLFASIEVNRPKIYVNQVFEITLKVYTQPGVNLDRNISLLDFDTTGLSLSGFEELAGTREAVEGRVYDVRRFRARATALTAGTFQFQPKVRVNVIVRSDRPRMRDPFFSDSFFDNFFSRVETRAHTIEARPLQLTVHELPPEGRPSNFTGAVGVYSFDLTVAPTQVRAGEPITLRMQIQGRGNLETVRVPAFPATDAFRAFDPQLVDRNFNAGIVAYEQVIIPRSAGDVEIPAIVFTYFDPERERYETVVRGPIPIRVEENPAGSTPFAQTADAIRGAPRAPLGTDLVYLKPAPRHWRAKSDRFKVPVYVHSVPAFALLVAGLYARRKARLENDPLARARMRAPRQARQGLARARDKLSTPVESAAALHEALVAFLGPTLRLAPGEVTPEAVCDRLSKAGMPRDRVNELRSVFDLCERLRYAGPSAPLSEQDREALLRAIERAPELLRECRRRSR